MSVLEGSTVYTKNLIFVCTNNIFVIANSITKFTKILYREYLELYGISRCYVENIHHTAHLRDKQCSISTLTVQYEWLQDTHSAILVAQGIK